MLFLHLEIVFVTQVYILRLLISIEVLSSMCFTCLEQLRKKLSSYDSTREMQAPTNFYQNMVDQRNVFISSENIKKNHSNESIFKQLRPRYKYKVKMFYKTISYKIY